MYTLWLDTGWAWLKVGDMATETIGRMAAHTLSEFNPSWIVRLDVIDSCTYKVVSQFWGLDG